MTEASPAHDFLLPRLTALIDAAVTRGVSPQGPHNPTARDEADFVKPIPWFGPS